MNDAVAAIEKNKLLVRLPHIENGNNREPCHRLFNYRNASRLPCSLSPHGLPLSAMILH
jgi:hypothetical protein